MLGKEGKEQVATSLGASKLGDESNKYRTKRKKQRRFNSQIFLRDDVLKK